MWTFFGWEDLALDDPLKMVGSYSPYCPLVPSFASLLPLFPFISSLCVTVVINEKLISVIYRI